MIYRLFLPCHELITNVEADSRHVQQHSSRRLVFGRERLNRTIYKTHPFGEIHIEAETENEIMAWILAVYQEINASRQVWNPISFLMTIQFGKSILNTRTIIRRIVNTINIVFAKVNTTVWISYELTKIVINILSTSHKRFHGQSQLALHQHLVMDWFEKAGLDGEARKTI